MININEEMKKLIEGNALALATVDEDGNPHCIAVGHLRCINKDKIIITDVGMNETIKNIQSNNKIVLTVWSRNWEENCVGYELKGTTEYFTSGEWKEFVENIPENKKYKPKGAILVTINKIKKIS